MCTYTYFSHSHKVILKEAEKHVWLFINGIALTVEVTLYQMGRKMIMNGEKVRILNDLVIVSFSVAPFYSIGGNEKIQEIHVIISKYYNTANFHLQL
jgi:hypothetical protein